MKYANKKSCLKLYIWSNSCWKFAKKFRLSMTIILINPSIQICYMNF